MSGSNAQVIVPARTKPSCQRFFRDIKESYTKQLEKKANELERVPANLQFQISRLSQMLAQEGEAGNSQRYTPGIAMPNILNRAEQIDKVKLADRLAIE